MTSEAAALTEQERAQLHNAGMTMPDAFPVGSIGHIRWSAVIASIESILAARLADSRPVVSEAAITEVLLRHREAQWSDGRSGCSPCGNHAEVTTREEAQAAQAIGHMDSYTDYCSHIAAALTAALPHMGDGRGDAEWNGDKRANGWLGKYDPAEMNTLARIVTDNAGERHPLFSVRYGIAVALLESDWLAERDKANWNEGHAMCCDKSECAGAYEGTPHRLSPTGDDTP